MKIVAELSLYPLSDAPVPAIVDFIHTLNRQAGVEAVSNQMSTQLRGEFEAVTGAINACMRKAMAENDKMVLVVKYLNSDLDITCPPSLTPDG